MRRIVAQLGAEGATVTPGVRRYQGRKAGAGARSRTSSTGGQPRVGRGRTSGLYLPRQNLTPGRGVQETDVAYIICEPCIGTKDSACVDVCPVDCIHPKKDEAGYDASEMLYIHPDECIDCGACVPACPVEAIFALDETPEQWTRFIPLNAQYYQK